MNNNNITFKESKIKVIKSLMYNENRINLENWLLQLNIYFIFNFNKKRQKTLFAITHMKKKSWNKLNRLWYNIWIMKKNFTIIFSNYDNFKKKIRIMFKVINKVVTFKKII